MEEESHWTSIEDMDAFRRIECLTDKVWSIVGSWSPFARDTIGKQLVRAADSVGANLVEGDGRFHHREKLHFFYVARASAREANYWVRRASVRGLLPEDLQLPLQTEISTAIRWINGRIKQRREWMNEVHEPHAVYDAGIECDSSGDQLTN